MKDILDRASTVLEHPFYTLEDALHSALNAVEGARAELKLLKANPAFKGKCTQCGTEEGAGWEWICNDCAEGLGI